MATNADLVSLQTVLDSQEQGRSRIQALRLFHNMFGMDSESTISSDDLRSLLSSALLASEHIAEIVADRGYRMPVATFGAEVLEDVGSILPDPQDPSVLSYLAYSSLNYLVTRRFANSQLLAEAALERFPAISQAVHTPDQFRFLIHRASLLLLASRLDELRRLTSSRMTQDMGRAMVGQMAVAELTCGLLVLRSLNNFATFVERNREEFLEAAWKDLERARVLGRTELLLGEITEWLHSIYEVCVSSYAPQRLAKFQSLPEEYLELLLSSSRKAYWLWPSQDGALEAGLLSHDRFAISMPPSAGKTFLAELKIVQRIAKTQKLAFYVVPLNALARQAQAELSNRLRRAPLRMNVRVLTGTYELGDEDLASAGVQESIIITTPEKLDGLLRNIDRDDVKDMFERADLFVFDECQNIGSGKRGVTLEMLIERIRFAKPDAAVLASAAFFSNIAQLSEWLGDGSSYYHDDWRPTRRQVASWSEEDGLVIDRRWQVSGYPRSGDNSEDVTRIAIDLQRVYQNVLVVATSRNSAEKYAGLLAKAVSNIERPFLSGQEARKLDNLAASIREAIHPQARLADFVKFGVAYHHARLPASIKSQIEDYISDGTLKLVAATTTLAQGVNFPIRCVVLSSIYFGPSPMDALALQNIVGRAGRAGVSTTGQVIVLRKSEWVKPADRFYKFDDYCFSPAPELLVVKSSLPIESGASTHRRTFERTEALDSQLLAFLGQGGLETDQQIERIAQGTFLAKESPARVEHLQRVVKNRLTLMEEAPRALVKAASPFHLTEFGEVVRKTGLGSTASKLIVQEIEQVLDGDASAFSTIRRGQYIDKEKLKTMLGVSLFDPENLLDSFAFRTRCKELFGVPISTLEQNVEGFLSAVSQDEDARIGIREAVRDVDLEVLYRWTEGASYSDLGNFFLKRSKSKPSQAHIDQAIGEAVHTVERYSLLLKWSAYYTGLLLEYLTEEKGLAPPSSELGNLGHYVRWGVNHPLSIFAREELEWGSRADAIALGVLGPAEVGYPGGKELLRDTLKSANVREVADALESVDKAEDLQRRMAFG